MKATVWNTVLTGTLLLLSTAPLSADSETENSQETDFITGGKITIELTAGEHRIVQGDGEQIRIEWTQDDDLYEVKARTTVEGRTARVDVDGPSNNNFRTVIEVPRDSDLKVRLTAGVLNIEDVGGDRDIRLRAGELRIEVDDTDQYAKVAGSLWAGDINAGPFQKETSGLFRSLKWTGEGENKLQFKLYAGDVSLYGGQ